MIKKTQITLKELYQKYVQFKILSISTQKKYYEVVNIFLKENSQIKYIHEISESVICDWRYKIINRSSNNNWNVYCRHLAALMNFAVNQRLISVNIVKDYKVRPINNTQIKILKLNDIEKIINYCNIEDKCYGWFWYAVTIILYKTGMRRRQLIGIKWCDIDLDNNILFLNGDYSKNGFSNYLPINDDMREAINIIVEKTLFRNSNEQVFNITKFNSRYKNNHTTPEHITHHYKRMSVKLGIAISPHRFRHTMATQICRKGGNIRALQRVLNHRSIATTEMYMHTVLEDKNNVMALVQIS